MRLYFSLILLVLSSSEFYGCFAVSHKKFWMWLCVIFVLQDSLSESETQLEVADAVESNNDWRQRRQFANLPNGAACLGNLDCASGCCLVQYEFAGVCVVRALPGQVGWFRITGVILVIGMFQYHWGSFNEGIF